MNVSQLINEILTEWAYRVDDGMPNPKNPTHIKELGIVLSEMGLSHIKNQLVENLLTEKGKTPEKHVVEADKQFKNPILNKSIKYKNTKGEDTEGLVGNLLRLPAEHPGRKAAERMLPPEGSEERDTINKDLGGENQPEKPETPTDDKGGGEQQPKEDPIQKAAPMFDPKLDPAMGVRLDKEKETLAQLAKDDEEKDAEAEKEVKPKEETEFNPIAAVDVQSEIPEADPDTFGGESDIPDGIGEKELEQFNTDIKKVKDIVADAKAKGEKAPNINLCQITVPGTNLYCDDNLGIPRAEMPQFKGKAIEGSRAANMPVDASGEVDTEPVFKEMLKEKGITVSQTEVPADKLKATQSELVGAKVVGMMGALEENPEHEKITAPIYVSRDGYVIDGHHRWAAIAAYNAAHSDSQIQMKVQVIDMDIKDAIPMCNKFAEDMGIAAKKADANKETPTEPKAAEVKPNETDPESNVKTFKGESSGKEIKTIEFEGGGYLFGTVHRDEKMVDDIVNQVKATVPKEKWKDIVFVGEGGATGNSGELEFNDEMIPAQEKFKEMGAGVDSFDGDALDVHKPESELYKSQEKQTGLSQSKIKAGNWASMIGQGEGTDTMETSKFLDDEGKQFLQDAAKEAGLPPIENFDNPTGEKPSEENGWKGTGDKGTLYRLSFPDDNGDRETGVNDVQVAFNKARDLNIIKKQKELSAQGKIPVVVAGEGHADLVDDIWRQKNKNEQIQMKEELLPLVDKMIGQIIEGFIEEANPKPSQTHPGYYHRGGGYYSKQADGDITHKTDGGALRKLTAKEKADKNKTAAPKPKAQVGKTIAPSGFRQTKDLKKSTPKAEPKPVTTDNSTPSVVSNGLNNGSLQSLRSVNAKLISDRDKGIAGAGGPVASYGEAALTTFANKLQEVGGFEGYVAGNKNAVAKKVGEISKNRKAFKSSIETVARQLGFVLPKDEAKVLEYIGARIVFGDNELARLKKDKNSLWYKTGKQGFGQDEDAFRAWARADFDGAISTRILIQEQSKIDTSKDYIVIQSDPKKGGHDDGIINHLNSKLEQAKAKGNKDDIAHYQAEVYAFTKLGFHDTMAVGFDKKGRTTVFSITNKKQDDLQDIWGNTTPEYALNLIKDSFGPKVSGTVVSVIEDGILKVSNSKKATTRLFSTMKLNDDFVAVCDTPQMKKYMGQLKSHKKFNQWLSDKKYNPTETKEWLVLAQKYAKENDDAPYEPFGKFVHKVGELAQVGPFVRKHTEINFESSAVKKAVQNKNDEKELTAAVHRDVVDSIAEADKVAGYPKKDGVNGPHTQAYLTTVMHSMHFDLMVENFDGNLGAITGIRGSVPSDFRECLTKLSGFKGEIKTKEGRDLLNKHLLQRCKLNPQTRAIEITNEEGTSVLAEDTWRTAGTSQKVEKKLGGGLRSCITNRIDKRQADKRAKGM
jgi:hypothetical protein